MAAAFPVREPFQGRELQQLALGLASMRQSIDQLVAQLAAGQQQMESAKARNRGGRQCGDAADSTGFDEGV
jgi:hypothetical protein